MKSLEEALDAYLVARERTSEARHAYGLALCALGKALMDSAASVVIDTEDARKEAPWTWVSHPARWSASAALAARTLQLEAAASEALRELHACCRVEEAAMIALHEVAASDPAWSGEPHEPR